MRVLNLGAGVQSTTLYLMALTGELIFDHAIFADTQDEPRAVYDHLRWLQTLNGPPIHIVTRGRIGDDLVRGMNTFGGRCASIPAFGTNDGGATTGLMRRQCSKEYKTSVIEIAIKRQLLGLQPRQRVPKAITVRQFYGITMDEARRARSIRERVQSWVRPEFPLLERFMTRADCLTWLAKFGVPHQVPKSACVFCPYHTDYTWQHLKDTDPAGWQRAIEVDEALRRSTSVVNKGLRQVLYLHRSCTPLAAVELRPQPRDAQMELSFYRECEGMCGV